MKENLFEMLLNLFEISLARLKNKVDAEKSSATPILDIPADEFDLEENIVFIKNRNNLSERVFAEEERVKLTKASYQFLTRLHLWGIIEPHIFELVINQLQFSDSHLVDLEETKWTIHYILSDRLDPDQLAFLDLVLYQKEDQFFMH